MRGFALIGKPKESIDTPALLIDLDAIERNINRAADYYRGKKGAALLPHQKGHRLPAIAKRQIAAGAKGVSITSLGLAEYYVQSGIDNILLTAEIYGENKINRLCSLSRHANITATVDNIENARQLSERALAIKSRINVAVELYDGKESCGVEFDHVKSFVKELVKLKGIEFKGLWHHGGESSIKRFEERKKIHFATLDKMSILKDEIEDAGITVEMLSAGYSCTWNITPEYSKLSNVGVQAGSYVLSDWCSHHHVEGLEVFDYALSVLTRCISRPKANEAMFDFGMNSCSDECGENYHVIAPPMFKAIEGIEEVSLREEVALAVLQNPSREIRVGDVYEVIPGHSDTTAKLYDKYYGMRDGRVELIWPNFGRGFF